MLCAGQPYDIPPCVGLCYSNDAGAFFETDPIPMGTEPGTAYVWAISTGINTFQVLHGPDEILSSAAVPSGGGWINVGSFVFDGTRPFNVVLRVDNSGGPGFPTLWYVTCPGASPSEGPPAWCVSGTDGPVPPP